MSSHPVILWKSILRNPSAVLTASSTAPDFDVNDISTMRPWKIWKAGDGTTPIDIDLDLGAFPDDADMLGIVNANIGSQSGTVKVFADSVFPPANVVLDETIPVSDDVVMIPFTAPGAHEFWRVRIGGPGVFANLPFIGELWLGKRTTLPEFPDKDVDPFMQQDEVVSQRSKGGHFLGAVIRGQRHEIELKFGGDAGISRSFFTSDLNAFYTQHAMQRRPFFYQVDPGDADFSRAFFLKVPDNKNLDRIAVGGVTTRFKGSIFVEEAWMELP